MGGKIWEARGVLFPMKSVYSERIVCIWREILALEGKFTLFLQYLYKKLWENLVSLPRKSMFLPALLTHRKAKIAH